MVYNFSRAGLVYGLLSYVLVSAAPVTAATAVAPRQCFQSFVAALNRAKDLSAVEQYFSKDLRVAYKRYTPAQRAAKLKELKEYYLPRFRIAEEKITNSKPPKAILIAKGRRLAPDVSKKLKKVIQTDTMDYVKEGSYWRITGAKFQRSTK